MLRFAVLPYVGLCSTILGYAALWCTDFNGIIKNLMSPLATATASTIFISLGGLSRDWLPLSVNSICKKWQDFCIFTALEKTQPNFYLSKQNKKNCIAIIYIQSLGRRRCRVCRNDSTFYSFTASNKMLELEIWPKYAPRLAEMPWVAPLLCS